MKIISRKIKYFLPVLFVVLTMGVVFGYDNITTHPQLTAAAINVYQNYSGKMFTQEQSTWIIQGSVDEDAAPRYLNHYYNPVTNSGLNDWDEFFKMNVSGISAKEWAQNQSGAVSHTGDYSEPAILENYRIGNNERAYQGVGHILHLIQDMSVPAHTRNDSHAGGDPYENWAKQNSSVDFTKASFIPVQNLNEAFDGLASYSNNNFFSKDTVRVDDTSKYIKREININGEKRIYLLDKLDGREYFLAYSDNPNLINPIYSIEDYQIHLSYWNLLSPKAVGYSAGVIDYFIKQFERIDAEKQAQKPDLAASVINSFKVSASNIQYMWGDFVMIVNAPLSDAGTALVKEYNALSNPSYADLFMQVGGLLSPSNIAHPKQFGENPQTIISAQVLATVAIPAPAQQLVEEPASSTSTIQINNPTPSNNASTLAESATISASSTADVLPPPVPVYHGSASVTGVSPEDALVAQNNTLVTATNVASFATSTNDVLAKITATTTDSTATTTDVITIGDSSTSTDPMIGNSATTTEPVIPASVIPEIVYSDPVVINEVAWMGTKAQANDEWIELYNKTNHDIDLSGWTLENNSKRFSVALSGSIAARGYFLLERTASTTTDQPENMTFTGAIVNSGSEANLYLKNGTTTIDAVDFSGQWPAGNNDTKYTMERVSAYAPSSLSYNWKTYGDPDAILFAKDAKGNDMYGTPGRKNSVSGYYTPTGNIIENTTWHKEQSPYFVPTTITVADDATLTIEPGVVVKFAKGAPYGGKMDVRGALHAEGAAEKPIIFTSVCDDSADTIDSNRDGSACVPAPGDWMNMVFSHSSQESLMRNARVKYGGQGVNTNPNSWYPTYTGVLSIQGASPEISDSLIEDNSAIGIYANNGARPKLYRNTIQDTVQNTYTGVLPLGVGVFVGTDASAEIAGNMFRNNTVGIRSESATDAPLIVRNNHFDSNGKNGEFVKGYMNWNLENSGNEDANKKGGFDIQFIVLSGQTKTMHADTMPYIIGGSAKVLDGGKLTIEPGAVFKFTTFSNGADVAFSVNGTLSAAGTADKPIVFTALADDSDGYDSNGNTTLPVPGAWKNIVFTGATSSDSVLKYVIVRYGGQGENICPYAYLGGPCMEYYGAVRIESADPTIAHATLADNLGVALFIEGVAHPTIENSTIRDTQEAIKNPTTMIGGYGISIGHNTQPVLADNTYANNAKDVVYR